MAVIHVVGVGLDGASGLGAIAQQAIEVATLLVGSSRHLSYFPNYRGECLMLDDLAQAIAQIRHHLAHFLNPSIVVLTSGDPLLFGLGRLLLTEFTAEQLTFHPHLSSIQLAFNRVKVPWQNARIISVHGRSLEELIPALQQGVSPLAVLTDATNTPAAIANLLVSLDLPIRYQLWVCENLEGANERIVTSTSETSQLLQLAQQNFATLNVVVLQRLETTTTQPDSLPVLGLPDQAFLSFPDRPGLMTKREVRTLALAELALQPGQVVWDIGAGTGSVSIEIARLCLNSTVYAIEKTAIGVSLIHQNCQRFQTDTIRPIQGTAPEVLRSLPAPDRIFIGGSGGNLTQILDVCQPQLRIRGRIVLALATLDHLTSALTWLQAQPDRQWQHHLLQVNLSRSIPLANLTRWAPLNPVTLLTLEKQN